MGWYLKKSFAIGPLRLNLSKSGLGASVGVKGLRVSTGPKGAQLNAGRGGLYYRTSLNGPRERHLDAQPLAEGERSTAQDMMKDDNVEPDARATDRRFGVRLLRQIMGAVVRAR